MKQGSGKPTASPFATLHDERGMTIMELLVASFIGLFVLGSVFAAVRVQGRSAAHQTGLADAQLTTRGSGELLLQDLRMAGFGMLGVSPADAVNFPPLSLTTAGDVTNLVLRGAYSNVTTTVATAVNAGATTINVTPPAEGAFQVNNLVLIDSGLSSEVKTITSVGSSGGNVALGLNSALANAYPMGPFVTQIEVVTYTWNGTVLRRNNQVVAESVPTFTLSFFDRNNVETTTPGPDVRSIKLNFEAAQPSKLPDNPTAKSRVNTEANMRNLAFRFDLS
jgi:Tfp pilus assembly protein PilW